MLIKTVAGSFLFICGTVNASLIGFGDNFWYTSVLENNLESQGHTVSVFPNYDSSILGGLDVYFQDGNSFIDTSLLEEFVFNGGTLIQLPWTASHTNWSATNLHVIGSRTSILWGRSNPNVVVNDASSWLLEGVTLPSAGDHVITGELGNQFSLDATNVLEWEDGTALLGYKNYGAGTVVYFNVHMYMRDHHILDADWSNQIIYNAIDGPTAVPEPSSLAVLLLGIIGLASCRLYKSKL